MVGVVAGITGALIGQRREAVAGQKIRDKKRIRVGVDVEVATAQRSVLKKRTYRAIIALRKKRVVVALVARHGGPVRKTNAAFVSGITLRHPLRFGDAETFEKAPHLRRRTLAYADDTDGVRLQQGDVEAVFGPAVYQQRGGHPTGGAAADDKNIAAGSIVIRHRSTS